MQNLLDILWALLPNYFVALCKILATPLTKQPRTVCNVPVVVILYLQYNSRAAIAHEKQRLGINLFTQHL